MRLPVSRNGSRTVEHKNGMNVLQRNIVNHLIDCTLHKGRIDAYDRHKTAPSESAGKSDGVFFCDTDVEKTFRITACESA